RRAVRRTPRKRPTAGARPARLGPPRGEHPQSSEEHTSELQSREKLVSSLPVETKKDYIADKREKEGINWEIQSSTDKIAPIIARLSRRQLSSRIHVSLAWPQLLRYYFLRLLC